MTVFYSKSHWSAYLTASLRIIPVVLALALSACSKGASPTANPDPGQSLAPTKTQKPGRTPAGNTTPVGGATPGSKITPTRRSTSSAGTEALDLHGTTIRFWYILPAQAAEVGDVMVALVDEFNRSNQWSIQVEATGYNDSGTLAEKALAAKSSNTLPDVLEGTIDQALSWDTAGRVFVDLNPYINDPEWGLTAAEQGDFYSIYWDQDIGPGKRLGIPFYRSAQLMFYNTTWAKELGYDSAPETPQEFRAQACAAARAVKTANKTNGSPDNTGTGGWAISLEPSSLASWIFAFGGEIARSDGKGYQLDTPEASRALTFLKGLQTDGCAWLPEDLHPNAEFADRKALFITSSITNLASQQAALDTAGSTDHWTVIPYPSTDSQPVMDVYGPALMIVKSRPNVQQAAWVFIKWLVSPLNQARWVKVHGLLPTRASTRNYLNDYATNHPQWAAAADLWPYAHEEPRYASWGAFRWALNDASKQLFSPDLKASQIPDLLKTLDKTAAEVYIQVR